MPTYSNKYRLASYSEEILNNNAKDIQYAWQKDITKYLIVIR